MALPPGPPGPSLRQGLQWHRRPGSYLLRCRRRYGDVFSLALSSDERGVVFTAPEGARAIFGADPETVPAGEMAGALRPLLGPNSLFTLDGPAHLRHRRLLLPRFHGEVLRAYRGRMEAIAEREVADWPVGRPFALRPRMADVAMEVILRVVFGVRRAERVEELGRVLRAGMEVGHSPLSRLPLPRLDLGPWSSAGRSRRRVAALNDALYEEIAARRDDPELSERDDVLSVMLGARDEADEPLTEGELRDELMTLLVAGHETTGSALAWTFERLVRHPAVLARLVAEIDAGEDAYLDAVVKESLRLRPIVPMISRRLTEPLAVDGHELPAGTPVFVCIFLLHRNERSYPDPHAFRPERFLDGAPEGHAYAPFGGGVHRCAGATFATVEMKTILRSVLQRVTLEPAHDEDERIRGVGVTFVPARGGEVVVRERRSARAPVVA